MNMNKLTKEKIKKVLYKILRDQMFDGDEFDNIIKDKSNDKISLYNDLGFDSLDITEIVLLIEYELAGYNITLTMDIDNDTTIEDIINYIYQNQS